MPERSEAPLLDVRNFNKENLPQCPSGCEKTYLNFVRFQPLDHGNYSPHAVDFVQCTKCDMQAPIKVWLSLPGIYGKQFVQGEQVHDPRKSSAAETEEVAEERVPIDPTEFRNLRQRFQVLVAIMVRRNYISVEEHLEILK